jgi:hypothetical protein
MEIRARPRDPKIEEESIKRYGITLGSSPQVRTEDDVFRYAEWIVENGKRLLTADGRHHAIVFIIGPAGRVKIVGCDVPDQESKYVAYREIANEVERTGATAVIFANEVWWIPTDKFDGRRAGLHPERMEAFAVVAATDSGRGAVYMVPFERDAFGKPVFGKTEVVENATDQFFLEPIRDVWAKKRAR